MSALAQAQVAVDEGCAKNIPQGQVVVQSDCDGIAPSGHWVINYLAGGKAEEGDYRNGEKAGTWRQWYPSGNLSFEREYADGGSGHLMAERRYYDHRNRIEREITYDENGKWLVWVSWDWFGRRSEQTNSR